MAAQIAPIVGVGLVLWLARRYDHPALPGWLRRRQKPERDIEDIGGLDS